MPVLKPILSIDVVAQTSHFKPNAKANSLVSQGIGKPKSFFANHLGLPFMRRTRVVPSDFEAPMRLRRGSPVW
jgi:hypothetical protein